MKFLERPFFVLLSATWRKWRADETSSFAAALSFYTLFSIVPILVVVIAVAGAIFGRTVVQGAVTGNLTAVIGAEGTSFIIDVLRATNYQRHFLAGVTSVVITLIASMAMFGQLKVSLDAMWGGEKTPFKFARYFFANLTLFALVLLTGLLLVVSEITSVLVATIATKVHTLNFISTSSLVLADTVAFFVLALGLIVLIYYLLPRRRLRMKNTIFGAFVTALLLTFGRIALTVYLQMNGVGSLYGAAGTVIVLLLWIYFSAQIFYFGAALTYVYANRKEYLRK
jgi:membrane protein